MLVNGKRETYRQVDVDPYFDNTKLMLGEAGSKIPYTRQNTYKDPNGDRQDYLERTKGMTTMQKVSFDALILRAFESLSVCSSY